MAKKKDLLSFLFWESAEAESDESDQAELKIAENLEQLFEVAAEAEQGELNAKKTPLAKALGEFGITDADLQLDTEGFVIVTDNHDNYVNTLTILGTADAMHKLAEMGWVVTKPGDAAMTNEVPEFRIRFLEITTVEAENREPKAGEYDTANREEVIKKAEEFATTPMDRDDKLNPVENGDGDVSKKNVGLGKAKDGDEAEKSMHEAFMSGDPDRIQEFTSTGSMGTALSQGQPFVGMVKKPKPYGKGTKFKTPGQWKVKQPVVDQQVKRKVKSESTGAIEHVEKAAQDFLSEEDDSESDFAGEVAPDSELINQEEFNEPVEEDITTEDHHTFWKVGQTRREPWLQVPREWEWDQTVVAIREQMQQDNFFPNVWFISDHGNAHLIEDIWPKPDPDRQPGMDPPEVTSKWFAHMSKGKKQKPPMGI